MAGGCSPMRISSRSGETPSPRAGVDFTLYYTPDQRVSHNLAPHTVLHCNYTPGFFIKKKGAALWQCCNLHSLTLAALLRSAALRSATAPQCCAVLLCYSTAGGLILCVCETGLDIVCVRNRAGTLPAYSGFFIPGFLRIPVFLLTPAVFLF